MSCSKEHVAKVQRFFIQTKLFGKYLAEEPQKGIPDVAVFLIEGVKSKIIGRFPAGSAI